MMTLNPVDGVDRPVEFTVDGIWHAAGCDTGPTSLVTCETENGELSISQHECGDWDISVDGEPYDSLDDGLTACRLFIQLWALIRLTHHGNWL